MAKKRITLSKTVEKRVFQQAISHCVFCPEADVASLQVHHIDGDPSHNAIENLLLVCANCHTKITAGVLSEADVRLKKRQLEWSPAATGAAVSVSISNSRFRGDIAQTITKVTTPRTPRVRHPDGSLGADLERRGYVDYLIARYFEFRDADVHYGRRGGYSHAELHKTIQREFGCRTFFMPIEYFPRLVEFLQMRINRTIKGKHNAGGGIRNYHSYDEHVRDNGNTGTPKVPQHLNAE